MMLLNTSNIDYFDLIFLSFITSVHVVVSGSSLTMKGLQHHHHLYRIPTLRSLSHNAYSLNLHRIATSHQSKRFCANTNDSKPPSSPPPPPQSTEERLKASFINKYSRKIQSSSTPAAWGRYENEIKDDPNQPRMAQDAFMGGFKDPEYEAPEEAEYDPNKKWGIPRGTFRGIVIGISCAIGAVLFFTLKPDPIVESQYKDYTIEIIH